MVSYKRLFRFSQTPRADRQSLRRPEDEPARVCPDNRPGLAARLKEALGAEFQELLAPSEARTSRDHSEADRKPQMRLPTG